MFDGNFITEPGFAFPNLWNGRIASYFPGLGPQGTTIYNWSNSNTSGSLIGTTAGNAWSFSQGWTYKAAGSDYFDCGIGLAAQLSGLAAASIAYWVYLPATGSSCNFGVSTSNGHRFEILKSGSTLYPIAEGGATYYRSVTYSPSPGWHHFVMVFTSSYVTVYIDGMVNSVSGSVTATTLATTGNLFIGKEIPAGVISSSGVCYDDLAIWNRVLSVDEILTLYGNGYGRGIAFTPIDPTSGMFTAAGRLLSLRRRWMVL